jgi:hypothetical protein
VGRKSGTFLKEISKNRKLELADTFLMILRPAENLNWGFREIVLKKPMIQTFYEKNETCRTPRA